MKPEGFIGFRVDDRMIHGIVATQWIPNLGATRAMVIDDNVATNDLMRTSMKMAIPAGVALSVISLSKAIENISNHKYANQKVFCVFRNINTAYQLFKAGVDIPQLNLGNVTYNDSETISLGKTVRVNSAEKSMLHEMLVAGVKIVVCFSTQDKEEDLSSLLK